jgi:hypothetical protein
VPPNGTNNCYRWQEVSDYGYTNGSHGAITFGGILTESPWNPYVDDNSTGEAYTNFLNILNSSPHTSQSSITFWANI